MAIYISNVNGDWWEFHSSHPLYILDTDNLNSDQIAEINEEWGGFGNDKFEDVIREFGNEVLLEGIIK